MLNENIELYEKELAAFEKGSDTSQKQILRILVARDRVQSALNDLSQTSDDQLLKVIELDNRLKQQAHKINQIAKLADWRNSLNIPVTSWWWFLQSPSHPLDNFDWLWNALTVASLTASLSLVVDISTRFLSGGTGFLSSFAVISQSLLTLLTAGSVLTKAGHKGVEQTLSNFGIKAYILQETKFGLSTLLLLTLIIFKASLPTIANCFNKWGLEHYRNSEWDEAIYNYERAISLNPNNAKTHHNLGRLYEQLQDLNKAETEYRLAVRGNIAVAYNDLARLFLIQDKPTKAMPLLFKARDGEPKVDQVLFSDEDKILMYEIRKNLGWARFKQQRYGDAQPLLKDAIDINQKITDPSKHRTYASAYCLLAQVLPKNNGNSKEIREQWKSCNKYGNSRIPEEDEWMAIAEKELKKQKGEE
ncbi:MAG: tetratricopeptide repeat protein [Nostocaceae cyanobacterium]|nr:tetratricopeptide repeat protein [Nostocaceae cyanobacterium]